MALKQSVLFSLVLLFVGSNGFSIDRKIPQGSIGLRQDFGPIIGDALIGIIATLPAVIPLNETVVPPHINLADLGPALNISLPLTGELNLRNVAIYGLQSTQVPVSTLNLNGILREIPLNLRVTNQELRIEAEYDMRGLVANIIPIRGAGVARISLNLTAGVDAEIKAKLGTNPLSLEMLLFDIILEDLAHIKVEIDGLLGNEELSAEIGKIIGSVLSTILINLTTPALAGIETTITQLFNILKLTYPQLLDIIQQVIAAIGSSRNIW